MQKTNLSTFLALAHTYILLPAVYPQDGRLKLQPLTIQQGRDFIFINIVFIVIAQAELFPTKLEWIYF